MALQLRDLQARADRTDEVVLDLRRMLDQVKAQGGGGSSPLNKDDRAYITKKLKTIRQQVVAEEQQIADQQKVIKNYETTLAGVKAKVRNELTNIRKQLLVDSARANPEEFRNEVATRLREIRAQLVSQKSGGGGGAGGDIIPPQIAAKIVGDLKKIRGEVLKKEREEADFRAELKVRLLALRKDVAKLEQENDRLKKGGASGRIPPKLQAVLVRKLKEIKTDVFNLEAQNLQLKMAAQPNPLQDLAIEKTMTVVDMHCAGEPLRIVETGVPDLVGATLLEKRKYMQANLDDYRQALLAEPRGHSDMYGAVITEADEKTEADFGVLFLTNEGYSTSCGHATLCLGRYAVDFGKVTPAPDATSANVTIQVPCGVVRVSVAVDNGKSTGEVRYIGSPSWAEGTKTVQTSSGPVEVSLAYGGTYYAVVPVSRFNMNIRPGNVSQLVEEASKITNELRSKTNFANPDSDDLNFLYGTILVDGNTNMTVFADKQVDRSPTGSGIQALLALEYANGRVAVNDVKEFTSVSGGTMAGVVLEAVDYNGKEAVTVEVRGTSRYTGRSTLYVEANDELRAGFYVR